MVQIRRYITHTVGRGNYNRFITVKEFDLRISVAGMELFWIYER